MSWEASKLNSMLYDKRKHNLCKTFENFFVHSRVNYSTFDKGSYTKFCAVFRRSQRLILKQQARSWLAPRFSDGSKFEGTFVIFLIVGSQKYALLEFALWYEARFYRVAYHSHDSPPSQMARA